MNYTKPNGIAVMPVSTSSGSRRLPYYSNNGLKLVICIVGFWTTLSIDQAQAQDIGNGHLELENPTTASASEIEKIYQEMRERLAEGYGLSKLQNVKSYQSWKRYNTSPYKSATHGQRFVNNYANNIAHRYDELDEDERLPIGSVLAKDSITLTDSGKKFPGALFIMEKMAPGKTSKTNDWRYVVINPDGSFLGDTTGDEPELVEYCHTCHAQVADNDFLFFVPKLFRAN